MDIETQQKIGVFLAVDSPITREGANSMMSRQKDMEVVGQTGSATEALSLVGDILPKTVVVVHTFPPKGSFELVYRLREISPEVSVILLRLPCVTFSTFDICRLSNSSRVISSFLTGLTLSGNAASS